jgi:CDP-glucose 4,6-dehydratase
MFDCGYSNSMFENLLKSSANGPVLITGHTGFKGSWLALLLNELGIQNYGISLPPEKHSHAELIKLDKLTPYSYLDIRDSELLSREISRISPSVIIHMAAQPIVSRAYDHISETFETNINGTLNLIEACKSAGTVKSLAVVTTDKVYLNEEINNVNHLESDPLGAHEPYGLSKVACEFVVDAYNTTASNHVEKIYTFRSGNVIGGGDASENRLLPQIAKNVFGGEELQIRNLEASRPWQHVLDTLHGYLLGIEYHLSGSYERSFNFSPSEASLTVSEVAEVVRSKYELAYSINPQATSSAALENSHLNLNSEKARSVLKWAPQFSQKEAILDTMHWWNAFQGGQDARDLSSLAIRTYLEKIRQI